ncbi:hypothetical protein IFM89_009121 [Coptis chinensis]|uniref:Bifunctional inhibitor/plant lipid transfer protein/seed storage helical domain-containing protein n=1 Tax=Coptis chinensis TaxID=261450 RepID=A0A835HPN2_9MAGN|nr:hypothetical protein IFM89_009121 [Coptis chinensis]
MEKMRIVTIALFAILVVIPKVFSMPMGLPFAPPRPLCLSQFALVNQACYFLPVHAPAPPANDEDPDEPDLKLNEPQAQQPPSEPQHRRRHHRHHHHADAIDNCCRWLRNLDDTCVCELLIRLPPFLRRLEHSYLVKIDEDCEVLYKCDGSWR